MKRSISIMLIAVFILAVSSQIAWGACGSCGAHGQATETAQDTATFDGGSGSTINTSVPDNSNSGSVPSVGEGRAYGSPDDGTNSYD